MKKLVLILFCLISAYSYGNESKEDKVLAEGKLLYRLEKASWYATDNFLADFPNLRDSIGGYLSYETEKDLINTIFFSRLNSNHIFVRYQFDSLPKPMPIYSDIINHDASEIEKSLIKIRQDAISKISSNEDKFFKFYPNTSFNPIPLISEQENKVYVITGAQKEGEVIIGNDYLLKYDKNYNFVSKERLHNSMVALPAKADSNDKDNTIEATIHSHVISDLIDPTDICTLLLYKEFVDWKSHYVISKKFVSIFDLEKETLVVMTRKAWEKISDSKRKK